MTNKESKSITYRGTITISDDKITIELDKPQTQGGDLVPSPAPGHSIGDIRS